MKRFILIFIAIGLTITAYPQMKKEIYLIVTTSHIADREQVLISTRKNDSLSHTPTIILHILSPEKDIRESFIHANYISESSTNKKAMDIKMISLSVFDKLKPVDLNKYLKKSDKKKFRNFCLKLRNNRIYIIDRDDIKNDSIKAIEVEYIRHLQY